MSVSTANDSPFAMANKLFPDSYYGQTAPVDHKLPVFSNGHSFSFKDVIDTINPLQHIPVISAIYRKVTGDEPGAIGRLAGGALYGGPLGLLAEEINCAIDDKTGKDVGEHAFAMAESVFSGSNSAGSASPPTTAVASAGPVNPLAQSTPATTPSAAEPPAPAPAPRAAVAAAAPTAAFAMGSNGLTPVANGTGDAGGQSPSPTPAAPPVTLASADAPLHPLDRGHLHFMPVPTRRVTEVQPQPLPVSLPISTSGQRSNVPVVGRPLNTYTAASAATVANQPADLIPASATVPTPATPSGSPGPSSSTGGGTQTGQQTWFSSAMMQGLDKYEKMRKLQEANPAP